VQLFNDQVGWPANTRQSEIAHAPSHIRARAEKSRCITTGSVKLNRSSTTVFQAGTGHWDGEIPPQASGQVIEQAV